MNMFRRERPAAQTPVVPPRPSPQDLENPVAHSINRQDSGTTPEQTQKTGVMGVMQKVNPFKYSSAQPPVVVSKTPSSESLENSSAQNPGVKSGMIQKINPFKSQAQNHVSTESQTTDCTPQNKQNPGGFSGMIQKVNPFKSSQPKDSKPVHSDLSSSEGSLADNNNLSDKKMSSDETPGLPPRPNQQISMTDDQTPTLPPRSNQQSQGVFKGMMQKVNPFKSTAQESSGDCQTDSGPKRTEASQKLESESSSSSCESLVDETIQRHSIWYAEAPSTEVQSKPAEPQKKRTMTFRLKRILPSGLFGSGTQNPAASEAQATTQLQETVEVQTLEFADVNDEATPDPLDDEDGLMSWWNTVEGWNEWNESTQDAKAEDVVEDAADRVFMAARLFVRLFNKRGGSLQQKILELLSLADAADLFHKKTVTASVGGGVASVAGSITTITGLVLAPFTAGASLIVTAVGIGVATAGGLASASANITDTVHSKTDRKKVEAMIQAYQDEMKDIKDCLDFLQEGMETLEQWDFEQYAEAISKKHLNQNVKHVMKEGGRAGKALVINTESLISTVQVLSVAGGAAKAAQVMSVTTGVMSGLFLALDVFFLAKDSIELKKGAKTDFADKIREVCKDLQAGLLELNRIKEDLQKTMDGIEVEVEEEEEDEEVLKSDLKKLVELEE